MKLITFPLIICVSATLVSGQHHNQTSKGPCKPGEGYDLELGVSSRQNSLVGQRVECVNNFAAVNPCQNIDLESFVSIGDLSNTGASNQANDIWGWSHENREFALVGLNDGTSFVEITDPINPVVLGVLQTHTVSARWRDIKTYQDYAFIVSEARGHGMQIFDLKNLLTAPTSQLSVFSETIHYSAFTSSHNIFINEDSGFAYSVGTTTCRGGLHMIDVRDPLNTVFAGCYCDRCYTHDVQCIIYDGPDDRYLGKEICFASNGDAMDVIDVSDKMDPKLISTFSYEDLGYVHQGWLTPDRRYFLLNDETDEYFTGSNTRTIICDVSDLENPKIKNFYLGPTNAIDHNLYIKDNFVYEANYKAGLRILSLEDIDSGNIEEVAYFDTFPSSDTNNFSGAWSSYPFFESGTVVISDINSGLFVVRPKLQSSLVSSSRTTQTRRYSLRH